MEHSGSGQPTQSACECAMPADAVGAPSSYSEGQCAISYQLLLLLDHFLKLSGEHIHLSVHQIANTCVTHMVVQVDKEIRRLHICSTSKSSLIGRQRSADCGASIQALYPAEASREATQLSTNSYQLQLFSSYSTTSSS